MKRDNNMDAVRYYLAMSVVIAHLAVCTGSDIPWPTSSYAAVGGFFAMSGFLIFRSYGKMPGLLPFLRRRARRILPPYVAVVVLAVVAGLFCSHLGMADYLLSGQTWRYLLANLAFLNFLEPELPGLFDDNLLHPVNGSLWTMKVEWGLYLSVPAVAWLMRRLRIRQATLCAAVVLFSVAYRLGFTMLYEATDRELYLMLARQFVGMMSFFYCGVLISLLHQQFLRWRWWLAGVAALLALAEPWIPYYDIVLYPFSTSILVLFFCYTGSWGRFLSSPDNFSYDLYLFHFPVIQLWSSCAPSLPLWQLAAGSIATALLLSWLSLTLIGRRFYPSRAKS